MVRSRAATVDAYLAELPGERRAVIARLRELTRSHLGGFQEGMEYGMPYYRGPKDRTFAFASQEGYVALYVGDRGAELARREKLDVGKACIRLRQLDAIDWDLVERIVRASGPGPRPTRPTRPRRRLEESGRLPSSVAAARPRRRRVTLPEVAPRTGKEPFPAPREFRPDRKVAPGVVPLLDVFRGLETTVPFQKYPGDDAAILKIARNTSAHVADGPGWMYVAPRKTPPEVRAGGFQMVESEDDVIVVARSHLANSPSMDLYLDIIHEFLHILQRKQGRELWLGAKFAYVDRPTEVEAYAFSVCEARRLHVPDHYLREYLRVTWVQKSEYLRLLRHVGVTAK